MKKCIEIIEEIKNTTAAIKAAEGESERLVDIYMSIEDVRSRIAKKKELEEDMRKNSETILNLKITQRILQSNATVALFHEVMPVALKVLAKYKGKPYGEKTRQKISDEVFEKTKCRFYISTSYSSQQYSVYPANDYRSYDFSCGTEYADGNKKPLLVDNKIQPITFDEVELYYVSREYVENVPERVNELNRLYAEAVAAQEGLGRICSEFNSLAVGDIPHIYADKRIYNGMRL